MGSIAFCGLELVSTPGKVDFRWETFSLDSESDFDFRWEMSLLILNLFLILMLGGKRLSC